ncbi:MAG: nuclear transport factor 2 family protein [Cytophagales bacterium]|nr:nuclear transport factor 2 family protein [Cytophagales bacterium]
MKKIVTLFSQILVLFLVALTEQVCAQISHDSDLYKTLKAQDSLLFEIGFNQCDLQVIDRLLPDRFEFFHDKDGYITSKQTFVNTLRENLCSNGQNMTERVLVEGSLEVFPLYEEGQLYGAIQRGIHQFGTTTARFTHLWLKEQDRWVPSKMLSFDHITQIAPSIADVSFIELSQTELKRYLGAYQFSAEFVLSIIYENGRLYGDAQGQKVEIKPYESHKFLDESLTMDLNFLIDNMGKVTGLEMDGPEGKMHAKKLN